MRKRPTDVIVWDHDDKLVIDLPKGAICYTLSNGTLRVTVDVPLGEPAFNTIVDCVGRPIARKAA
jgi:hypothetical protein